MKRLFFILLLLISSASFGQIKALSASGIKNITTGTSTVSNSTTNLVIVQDTIKANTMASYKKASFTAMLSMTSQFVAPTVNIKVTFGAVTTTLAAALPISASLSNQPIIVEGYIKNKGTSGTQLIQILIKQGPTLVLGLGGNAGIYSAQTTIDTTVDNLLTVTANFSTAVAGSTMTLTDAELIRDL